jgi:short subunit dehydrogenase-like uncharacterized protein
MQPFTFLLYGANGYTGQLIARHAAEYGLRPILAGRRCEALEPLAQQLGLPYQVIDLNDTAALHAALRPVPLVVHAAGPFAHTARQMVEACLQTGTHYTDINGDISVFELLKGYDAAAQQAGIMVMPGVGFDVVPTDCIAQRLHQQLPDATHLQLAFATEGGQISHGTAMTMAGKLGEGGATRHQGRIVKVPLGQEGMWVDFGTGQGQRKKWFVMSIPWGDISTAHFTTGIPNITTYTGMKPKVYRLLKWQWAFNWLLRTGWVRRYVKKKIAQRPAGPSNEQRAKAVGYMWGRATNAVGQSVEARLCGPEGYTITLHATLIIARKILNGQWHKGYQTPAKVYGAALAEEVPGLRWTD